MKLDSIFDKDDYPIKSVPTGNLATPNINPYFRPTDKVESINNPSEAQFYKFAKAWYSGDHNTPDNIVPGKSAGNKLTVGEYANKALSKFKKTGDWRIGLGAVEGSGNKIDTKTQLKSSALGRLQIVKGTREQAYRQLGIPPSQFQQAEQTYITDPQFQSKVEDAVKDSFMSRINKFKFGGDLQPKPKLTYNQWFNKLPKNLQDTDTTIYNLRGAYEGGLKPELAEDGTYHLGSRNPKTGEILKTPNHPTWNKMIEGEKQAGYELYQKDNKWYSRPILKTKFKFGGKVGPGNPSESTRITKPLKVNKPLSEKELRNKFNRDYFTKEGTTNDNWLLNSFVKNEYPEVNNINYTGKRSNFNPFTRNINLTKKIDSGIIDSGYIGNDLIDELSHVEQLRNSTPVKMGKRIVKDVIKAGDQKSTYKTKGTLENEAHSIISYDVENKYLDYVNNLKEGTKDRKNLNKRLGTMIPKYKFGYGEAGNIAGIASGFMPDTSAGTIASGVLSGASMGSSFGPIGMGVGAAIGLGKGLIDQQEQKRLAKKKLEMEQLNFMRNNQMDTEETNVNTFFKVGGKPYDADYEVEKGEVVTGNPILSNSTKLAEGVHKVTGYKHGQYNPRTKGEGVYGVGGNKVYSASIPFGKKTVADEAIRLGKLLGKYQDKRNQNNRVASDTGKIMEARINEEMEKLFEYQENYKVPQYKFGGLIKFKEGGDPEKLRVLREKLRSTNDPQAQAYLRNEISKLSQSTSSPKPDKIDSYLDRVSKTVEEYGKSALEMAQGFNPWKPFSSDTRKINSTARNLEDAIFNRESRGLRQNLDNFKKKPTDRQQSVRDSEYFDPSEVSDIKPQGNTRTGNKNTGTKKVVPTRNKFNNYDLAETSGRIKDNNQLGNQFADKFKPGFIDPKSIKPVTNTDTANGTKSGNFNPNQYLGSIANFVGNNMMINRMQTDVPVNTVSAPRYGYRDNSGLSRYNLEANYRSLSNNLNAGQKQGIYANVMNSVNQVNDQEANRKLEYDNRYNYMKWQNASQNNQLVNQGQQQEIINRNTQLGLKADNFNNLFQNIDGINRDNNYIDALKVKGITGQWTVEDYEKERNKRKFKFGKKL